MTEGSNSASRADMIREAVEKITFKMAEAKAINADIRAIKQSIVKAGLGFSVADFNAALRLYSLEADARDGFLDTIKECFAALGVGAQLNFLDVADKGPVKAAVVATEKVAAKRGPKPLTEKAFEAGYKSGVQALGQHTTPEIYKAKPAVLAEWERGYKRGFDDSHPNAPADRPSQDFKVTVGEGEDVGATFNPDILVVADEESDDAAFVSDDAWDEVQVQAG